MINLPFDNRDGFIWLDGKMVAWRDAQAHVLTHAIHYSTSVFEGERAYNGKIFKSVEHSERLINSAKQIYMDIPYDVAALEQAKAEAMAANNFKDCYIRAFAWYGGEQMGIDVSKCVTHVAIACWDDWVSYFDPEQRKKGLALAVVDTRRPPPNTMRVHSKSSGNYQLSVCAKHEAKMHGAYDALMLDWEGYVAESSGSNIFFMKNGKLITPNADRFLNGITRQTIIDLARKEGLEIDDQRRITLEELWQADEIFLTGTAAEVSPVGSIKHGNDLHTFEIGPITLKMMETYSDLVKA